MRIGYHSALVSCEVCYLSYAVMSVGGEALPVGGYNIETWHMVLAIAAMAGVLVVVRRGTTCR